MGDLCMFQTNVESTHGISVLVDPQRCAARYLECALGSDKLIHTFLSDQKLNNKLIRAVTNGLTILVQCQYDAYLTKDIWYFLSRDPGIAGNEIFINSFPPLWVNSPNLFVPPSAAPHFRVSGQERVINSRHQLAAAWEKRTISSPSGGGEKRAAQPPEHT